MVLAKCEMQTASLRIWTQVAKFISGDNHYAINISLVFVNVTES